MNGTFFHLAEIAVPHDRHGPWGAVMDGMAQCSVEVNVGMYGYDDLADDNIAADLANYGDRRDSDKLWLVALAGARPEGTPGGQLPGIRLVRPEPGPCVSDPDEVLAVSYVNAPRNDNTHMIEASAPQIRPAARGQGIEEAMFDAHEQAALRFGRQTILGWVGHRGAQAAPGDGDPLRDPNGDVRLRRDDPTVARYLAAGYGLAQAERHSVQPIPVPAEVLSRACDRTGAEKAGYEVVQWAGLCPDEHLDDVAALNAAMATDPPLGQVDWRPEVWDAGRVRRGEERHLLDGSFAATAVRHRGSGRIVGFTQIATSHRKPEVSYQWSTIVLDGHRGHGLGLLLKAENARLLQEAFPSVRRVHTWNADENDHMLAINIALGYAPENVDGCWQKVLS